MRFLWLAAVSLVTACAHVPRDLTPRVDHHQHVFSESLVAMMAATGSPGAPVITADRVVSLLDDARIGRAVLLSAGYIFESPFR